MDPRKRNSVFHNINNRYYDFNSRVKLYSATRDSLDFVQRLNLVKCLNVHRGCVNSLWWNERGNLLLSGSDDQHLVVTNALNYKVDFSYRTSHRANIFSARFMPNSGDANIVSCSGDGIILYTDLNKPIETLYNQFLCHSGTTYEVVTIPNDPHNFASCGEDGTVRWFDLRVKKKCKKLRCLDDVMITCRRPVTALCINPTAPYEMAVGCSDGKVRIFDRRTLGSTKEWTEKNNILRPISCFIAPDLDQHIYRITSLSYSPDAEDILVSYSSDYLYLFGVKGPSTKKLSRKSKSQAGNVSGRKVRKLRLRGDWSDTGPDARPEREAVNVNNGIGQARPQLQATLMQRMTDVLTRMLNDPQTRAALSGGGENSLDSPRSRRSIQAASSPPADRGRTDGVNNPPNNNEPSTSTIAESTAGSSTSQEDLHVIEEEQPETEVQSNITDTSNIDDSIPSTSGAVNQMVSLSIRNEPLGNEELWSQEDSSSPALTSTTEQTMESEDSSNLTNENQMQEVQIEVEVEEQIASTSRHEDSRDHDSSDTDVVFQSDSEDEPISGYHLEHIGHKFATAVNRENIGDETFFNEENTSRPQVKRKFTGHRNARTMIKEATFYGNNYVMSGSDCGHIFVWDRYTGKIVMLLEGDQHVVNCIQPHPTLPLIATSGIDYDVKLWAPVREEVEFSEELVKELTERNEIMLEETRDTITVPAAFMIRMLACLNQIRRGGPRSGRSRNQQQEADTDSN